MTKRNDIRPGIFRSAVESASSTPELRNVVVRFYYSLLEGFLRPVVKIGITPNAITVFGLLLSLIAAIYYARGSILLGGVFLILTGFVDTLDGSIARLRGESTRFGALLDSTLDRYSEFFIFFGLLVFYRGSWMFYTVLAAMMGSLMVSYVKARAESLGRVRVIGLMQRPERFALLIIGSVLNGPVNALLPHCPDCLFITALVILAFLSNVTALRRLFEGKKDLA